MDTSHFKVLSPFHTGSVHPWPRIRVPELRNFIVKEDLHQSIFLKPPQAVRFHVWDESPESAKLPAHTNIQLLTVYLANSFTSFPKASSWAVRAF